MKRAVFLLLFASIAAAVEPNFVRTTVYGVGFSGVANLVTTDYSDGLGRSIQSKVQIGPSKDRVSCTFYDDAGRPDTTTKVFVDDVKPGAYLPNTLDNLKTSPDGLLWKQYNDEKPYSYTTYSDDPLSRVIEQNGPGDAYKDFPVKTYYFGVKRGSDPITSNGTTIQFDDGLITSTITDNLLQALASYTWTNPDHFLTVVRTVVLNSDGTTTHNVYTQELKDLFGKTVATKVKPSAIADVIAKYTFDILGNLKTEVAPKPNSATINDATYTYNTLGQLIKKTTPDGGVFGYAYTPTGQLACDTSRDESGNVVYRIRQYQYDDLDRQIEIDLKKPYAPGHSDWTPVIMNFYDNVDELSDRSVQYNIPSILLSSLENLNGRLVASVAVNIVNGITYYVSDLFSYDDEGRIAKKIKLVPGLPLQEISYTYDLQGKVLTENTVCGSKEIDKEYQYDAEGRLKNVVHVNNGNKLLAVYNYDELGRTESKGLPIGGGQQINYAYNIRDWTTAISPPSGANYANYFEETIPAYLKNGNIGNAVYKYTKNSGPTSSYDLTYTYDDVNRLTGVATSNTDYVSTYTYDEIGRITSKKEGTNDKPGYKYYAGNNRLMNTKNITDINDADFHDYYFDQHGNLVVDKIKNMVIEYDCRDMPVAFRFYNSIPPTISATNSGQYTIAPTENENDLYRYMALKVSTTDVTLLSQVVMLYDASGNRVLKMEGR